MTIKQQGGIFGRNPTFNDVDVDGNLFAAETTVTANSTVPLTVNRTGSQGDTIQIEDDGTKIGTVGVKGGALFLADVSGSGLRFESNAIVMTDGDGDKVAASYGFGLGSYPIGNIYQGSGYGIYMNGGTGNANKFDDYEEGTWTPDVQDASGNSASTSSASGTYTKVGDIVTAFMRIVDVNKSGLTAGDAIRVYGLPYTGGGSTRYGGSAIINTWTGTTGLITQVIGGNTYAQFKTSSNGNALVSEITSGTADIYAQVTYKV